MRILRAVAGVFVVAAVAVILFACAEPLEPPHPSDDPVCVWINGQYYCYP
jgi:hypothetical protein